MRNSFRKLLSILLLAFSEFPWPLNLCILYDFKGICEIACYFLSPTLCTGAIVDRMAKWNPNNAIHWTECLAVHRHLQWSISLNAIFQHKRTLTYQIFVGVMRWTKVNHTSPDSTCRNIRRQSGSKKFNVIIYLTPAFDEFPFNHFSSMNITARIMCGERNG